MKSQQNQSIFPKGYHASICPLEKVKDIFQKEKEKKMYQEKMPKGSIMATSKLGTLTTSAICKSPATLARM